MNLNKVFLIGRLTRDPQIKALSSGQSVASFGLATDRFYTDKNGQKQQQTEFHNIVAFGKLSDIVSQFLTKGGLVMIEGRLQTRSWKDNAGNQRTRTEIIAERLQMGPRTNQSGQSAREGFFSKNQNNQDNQSQPTQTAQEEIPIIQENIPIIEEEIDVKDIPF